MTSLAQLTQRIVTKRIQRGFVTDPLKIYTLLNGEVGEIAGELKRTWSANYDPFSQERLADEIADVFVLLAALADQFEIDEVKYTWADEGQPQEGLVGYESKRRLTSTVWVGA